MPSKLIILLYLVAITAKNADAATGSAITLTSVEYEDSREDVKQDNSIQDAVCPEINVESENTNSGCQKFTADLQLLKRKQNQTIFFILRMKNEMRNLTFLQTKTFQYAFNLKSQLDQTKLEPQNVAEDISEIKKDIEASKMEQEAIVKQLRSTMQSQRQAESEIADFKNELEKIKRNEVLTIKVFKLEEESQICKNNLKEITLENDKLKNQLQAWKSEQTTLLTKIVNVLELRLKPIDQVPYQCWLPKEEPGKDCIQYGQSAASCIQMPFCAYCIKDNFPASRCDLPENLNANECKKFEIIDPNEEELLVGPEPHFDCSL